MLQFLIHCIDDSENSEHTNAMSLKRQKSNEIALNVTRTRITVLVFNLTIIAFMLSIISTQSGALGGHITTRTHLTSSAALFIGFCLTLLGLLLLLFSQNLDTRGMSRPWPFAFGAITTFLALSQTVTAFVHEYLIGVKSSLAVGSQQAHALLIQFDDVAISILFIFGGVVWILTTYLSPLTVIYRSPVTGRSRWFLVAYYFMLQIPIYWVYATTWQLEYVPVEQNILKLFVLQFVQPVLW